MCHTLVGIRMNTRARFKSTRKLAAEMLLMVKHIMGDICVVRATVRDAASCQLHSRLQLQLL